MQSEELWRLWLQRINGAAKVVETSRGQVDLDAVLNIKAFSLQKVLEIEPDFMKVQCQQVVQPQAAVALNQ